MTRERIRTAFLGVDEDFKNLNKIIAGGGDNLILIGKYINEIEWKYDVVRKLTMDHLALDSKKDNLSKK